MMSAELAPAALSCVALTRARRLAEWVGPGRTLTASGVLRPAEAVQACHDLGIELPGPRLRSALDVEELMRDWVTAAAAGFLQLNGRRACAASGQSAAGSSSDPSPDTVLNGWVRAATTVLELGEDPCAGCLMVLHELHTADGPLATDQLTSAVQAALEPGEPEGMPCPDCGEVHGPDDLAGLAGFLDDDEHEVDTAQHTAGTVSGLLAFGAAERADAAVRLTPLGTLLAASVFQGRAPGPGADAAAVVVAISELPPPVARTVAGPWLAARPASGAARELLAFAESADGNQRITALAFAGELGTGAIDAWWEWAEKPGFGAYARQWLSSQGQEVAKDPADEAWLAVDALSLMLDELADSVPPFLLQAALAEQAGGEVAEAAEVMLSSGHPRAEDVVTLLTGRPARTATRGLASSGRDRPGPAGRAGATGRSSGERGRRPEPGALAYQLKITLRGATDPPVWRRIVVHAGITLRDLHRVIQEAMGWEDYHLYMFGNGRREFGPPGQGPGFANDQKARLSEVLAGPGARLHYTYDFGDEWEHDIVLEETRPEVPAACPVCVAGNGACPPEDCGGVWGYANLKKILASPAHDEHQDMLDWLGLDDAEEFDPQEFSIDEANLRLGPLTTTR